MSPDDRGKTSRAAVEVELPGKTGAGVAAGVRQLRKADDDVYHAARRRGSGAAVSPG